MTISFKSKGFVAQLFREIAKNRVGADEVSDRHAGATIGILGDFFGEQAAFCENSTSVLNPLWSEVTNMHVCYTNVTYSCGFGVTFEDLLFRR